MNHRLGIQSHGSRLRPGLAHWVDGQIEYEVYGRQSCQISISLILDPKKYVRRPPNDKTL